MIGSDQKLLLRTVILVLLFFYRLLLAYYRFFLFRKKKKRLTIKKKTKTNSHQWNPNKLFLFLEASQLSAQRLCFDCSCIAKLIKRPGRWAPREEEGHKAPSLMPRVRQHQVQWLGSAQQPEMTPCHRLPTGNWRASPFCKRFWHFSFPFSFQTVTFPAGDRLAHLLTE